MDNARPDSVRIPDKLYFKIGEVAELAGVPSYVLRFWETEFARIKPKRTSSGQRLYRKNDVALILTIKHLLHERKFTIQGAKQHLKGRKASTVDKVAGPPDTRILDEIRTELISIRKLLD